MLCWAVMSGPSPQIHISSAYLNDLIVIANFVCEVKQFKALKLSYDRRNKLKALVNPKFIMVAPTKSDYYLIMYFGGPVPPDHKVRMVRVVHVKIEGSGPLSILYPPKKRED